MAYLIWRACERWALWPFDWVKLPQDQRDLVLAYEQVRMQEEMHVRGLTAAPATPPTP